MNDAPDTLAAQAVRAPSSATDPSVRLVRSVLLLLLVVMVAIGLVLLFLLTQATANSTLYERNYAPLFGLNVVVAALLALTILWVALRLASRVRRGKFGSRLLVKLAATFALTGFLPGALIYVVSYQFVSRSIESWFDVKVEGALTAGLNLGRATLEALSNDLAGKARSVANQLADVPDALAALPLERALEQLGAQDAVLWNSNGQLIAATGASRYQLNPDRPTQAQLRNARTQRAVTWIEGLDDAPAAAAPLPAAQIKALVLVNSNRVDLGAEARYLLVSQRLPATLVRNALAVNEANREYQERALAREGLRRMYIGTLTLSLFLAVFGAVLLAVLIGNQIARPLLLLAAGVRQVAAGDLGPKASLSGRDELDGLTRAFADMTLQLADARHAVQSSMHEVESARAHLQTIMDNLTAGVIVLDAQGKVLSSNPGATRILRLPIASAVGRGLAELDGLHALGAEVEAQFEALRSSGREHGVGHWQQSFELNRAAGQTALADGAIILLARGALLPGDARLLVFDDISEIVSAQRTQAWGEVARRLAHEIKNPLTPIQLSAERLARKLSDKIPVAERPLLDKAVKTIVDQVEAMKRLVNEFRDYARLPAAELKPVQLNTLVQEVLQLYGCEGTGVPVVADLAPDCPPVPGDAQQLRQVLHNLLQNAQDATESAGRSATDATVLVKTRWTASTGRVRLTVQDQGCGFPEAILQRAFEPYVTTKSKGTGLGLAVVKKIADEHHCRIDLSNRVQGGVVVGAQVSLSFTLAGAAAEPAHPKG
jgi:nitrogen fixation/metabolism regulation signal transduction histidine kinase